MSKKLFNMDRVDEAATFIAAELKVLLDRYNTQSHMQKRLGEACPAYQNGLLIGETVLATLRALSIAQLEISADMAELYYGADDVDDEEPAAA